MAIIRATTPTIIISFSTVDVSQIEVANLYIKQRGTAVITRDISTATVGESTISWTLTQAETLLLSEKSRALIVCDWLLSDGTRGRSYEVNETVENSGKNEVINA